MKVVALTATATSSTRVAMMKTLNMQKPKIVSIPPLKDNIIYHVAQKTTFADNFNSLANKLLNERTNMGRVFIFCRKCEDVSEIYLYFRRILG